MAELNERFALYLQDLQNWPESLRTAVSRHGGRRVWEVGLTAIGYPPTWINESLRAATVLKALGDGA